jgi:hypothetical protein
LQARYLEARERDAFAALNLVFIGGCLAFSYVLKAGFQASLENNASFGSKICFLAAGLKSYVLAVTFGPGVGSVERGDGSQRNKRAEGKHAARWGRVERVRNVSQSQAEDAKGAAGQQIEIERIW